MNQISNYLYTPYTSTIFFGKWRDFETEIKHYVFVICFIKTEIGSYEGHDADCCEVLICVPPESF